MSRKFLRDWALVLLVGFLGIFIQSKLLAPLLKDKIQLDFIIGLIIWLGFFKQEKLGAPMAFVLSFLEGVISGVYSGIYMLAGMSIYLLARFLRIRFAPQKPASQLLFVLIIIVFYKLLLIVFSGIFVSRNYFFSISPIYILLEGVINSIFAILIFMLFNQVKGFFDLIPEEVRAKRS